MKIIDVNAAFGVWPIQPFAHNSLAALDSAYDRNGVGEVWVSAVESILFPDPDVHDLALFAQLKAWPRFRAVKTVNPLIANWRESCLYADEEYGVAALKLFPNYHGVPLSHVEMIRLSEFAAAMQLPLLIAIRLNDERNQPVCMQVPRLHTDALIELAGAVPKVKIVALSAYLSELRALSAAPNIYADLSFLDEEDVLLMASEQFPAERLVYGSHAPFLYPEAATLKLAVTALSPTEVQAVASGNALRLSPRDAVAERNGHLLNGHAALANAVNAP